MQYLAQKCSCDKKNENKGYRKYSNLFKNTKNQRKLNTTKRKKNLSTSDLK